MHGQGVDGTLLQGATVLMALLQPAPEVYNLFQDLLLMSEGVLHAALPSASPAACMAAC